MKRRRRHSLLPDLRPEKEVQYDEHDCVCGTRLRYLFDRVRQGDDVSTIVPCPACGWIETIPGTLLAVHFKRSNGRWKEASQPFATPGRTLFEA